MHCCVGGNFYARFYGAGDAAVGTAVLCTREGRLAPEVQEGSRGWTHTNGVDQSKGIQQGRCNQAGKSPEG